MVESPQRLDIETVVRAPADYFAAPIDVVHDSRFTHDEKHRILEFWALDAQIRSQAEAENMRSKNRPPLQEVDRGQFEGEVIRTQRKKRPEEPNWGAISPRKQSL
jgi:hypothetical protein